MKLRDVLAKNIAVLMDAKADVGTEVLLRRKAKLGGGTLDGARQATTSITIDSLEKMAAAFRLQPWQMLVPDINPDSPPQLKEDESDRLFYSGLEQKIHLLQEEVAQYASAKKSTER